MSTTDAAPIPSWRDWGVALGIFLGGVVLMTVAGKGNPPTRGAALAAAGFAAAATFATAAWAVRFSRYPRWAYWGSAAALATCALAAAATMPDLHAWQKQVASSLWMNPWYPLAFTVVVESPRARACAAGTARGAWIMLVTAVALGAIGPTIAWLFA